MLSRRSLPADDSGLAATLGGGLALAWIGLAGARAIGRPALPLDDSWIHLELARHLAAGHGMAYEAGVPVAASTAPLWTSLLALLPGDPVRGSQFLGAAALLLCPAGASRLARALGLGPLARRGAPWLVATMPWLLWSGLSGMEVPLVLALTLWGLAGHHEAIAGARPTDRRGFLLLALAPLVRPETLLLLGFALFDRWRRFGRATIGPDLLLGLLAVAPAAGAYTVIGGSPLPTTLAAKASGGPSLDAAGRFLRLAMDVMLRSVPLPMLFATPALITGLRDRDRRGAAAAAWVLGLPLAYALLTPARGAVLLGNFGRYLFPLLPLVALFGLEGLQRALGPWRGGRVGALAALVGVQALLLAGTADLYVHTLRDVEATDAAAARWLREQAPPDLVVGAQDVGAIGFLAPQRVLGLVGIVEPEVRRVLAPGPRYWEEALLAYLDRRRPDLLVVFRTSYPMIARPHEGFRVLARFERPENRTMAGRELVVLQTPWSRWDPGGR